MNAKSPVLAILFLLVLGQNLRAEITVSEQEWDIGTIGAARIISKEIMVGNNGTQAVTVAFIPTCDCFYTLPGELPLKAGERKQVTLYFNPAEERGKVEKLLIMESSTGPGQRASLKLHGRVEGPAGGPGTVTTQNPRPANRVTTGAVSTDLHPAPNTAAQGNEAHISPAADTAPITLPVTLYYSFGCKTCERLLDTFFPELESRLGITFLLNKKNILNSEILQECSAVLAQNNVPMREFPALVMGDTVLQGEGEIRAELEHRVEYILEHPALLTKIQAGASPAGRSVLPRLLFFPVLAAGLVDGINPCAFSTLIFLIVSLAYVGKQRRAIFYTGIFFTLAVFITYFLIGLGFFYVLRVTTFAPMVSGIIKYLLILLLVVFAGLSIYDFILIKRGRSKDIVLQLPKSIKKRIHKSVRAYASSVALISGALVLGFMVSVFELACTGQIYFPVIAAIIQTENDLTAYLFLGLYNLGFIAPLAGVFGLVYAGVSSQRITTVFQQRMGLVKISLAVVFVMLAGIMVFF